MAQVRIKLDFSGASEEKSENVNFVILSAGILHQFLKSLQ